MKRNHFTNVCKFIDTVSNMVGNFNPIHNCCHVFSIELYLFEVIVLKKLTSQLLVRSILIEICEIVWKVVLCLIDITNIEFSRIVLAPGHFFINLGLNCCYLCTFRVFKNGIIDSGLKL